MFAAPEGFSYQWYEITNPSQILGTDMTFTHFGEATKYYHCIVSNIENPECQFILSAVAGNRFPNAYFNYDYTFKNCEFVVNFHNLSYTSSLSDGSDTLMNYCETYQWIFHDGSTSSLQNPTRIYTIAGEYYVTLVASLTANKCMDTITIKVNLLSLKDTLFIMGENIICAGVPTTLTASMQGTYLWNTGNTTQSITIAPFDTTLYSVSVFDTFGCTSTDEHLLNVLPSYYDLPVYDTICLGQYFAPNGNQLIESGVYYLPLQTKAGCDSTIYLHLFVDNTCGNISVSNAFTPDASTNNVFKPYAADAFDITFEIYNRWGDLLFATKDLNEAWDGTFKDKPCQQGVYVWKLLYRNAEYPSTQQIKYGLVMLIR
jgi:gliding motility-associated-like protein